MIIPGLRCSKCGEGELIAVWPCAAGMQVDMFEATSQRPVKCWCERCWLKDFAQPALPRRGSRAKSAALTNN